MRVIKSTMGTKIKQSNSCIHVAIDTSEQRSDNRVVEVYRA